MLQLRMKYISSLFLHCFIHGNNYYINLQIIKQRSLFAWDDNCGDLQLNYHSYHHQFASLNPLTFPKKWSNAHVSKYFYYFYSHLLFQIINNNIQQLMPPSRLYSTLRTLITLILTISIMIPVIYIVGSEQSFHEEKALYVVYGEQSYIKEKIKDIQSFIRGGNREYSINIYSEDEKLQETEEVNQRNWENLVDFGNYLGYYLNQKGYTTVDQTIDLSQVPIKKNQKEKDSEYTKIIESAYKLNRFGNVYVLKSKINRVAKNSIKRMNINEVEGDSLLGLLKTKVVNEVQKSKVWLVLINPQNFESHSSELLRKQLAALSKESPADKFIVISKKTASIKSSQLLIRIDQAVLRTLKVEIEQILIRSLNLSNIQTAEALFCETNGSLLQLNGFVDKCRINTNCNNLIRLLGKKEIKNIEKSQKEFEGIGKILKKSCEKGKQLEYEEWELLSKAFNLNLDIQSGQEMIKRYYWLSNGERCTTSPNCSLEWLSIQIKNEAEVVDIEKESVKKDMMKKQKEEKEKIVNLTEKDSVIVNQTVQNIQTQQMGANEHQESQNKQKTIKKDNKQIKQKQKAKKNKNEERVEKIKQEQKKKDVKEESSKKQKQNKKDNLKTHKIQKISAEKQKGKGKQGKTKKISKKPTFTVEPILNQTADQPIEPQIEQQDNIKIENIQEITHIIETSEVIVQNSQNVSQQITASPLQTENIQHQIITELKIQQNPRTVQQTIPQNTIQVIVQQSESQMQQIAVEILPTIETITDEELTITETAPVISDQPLAQQI